MKNKKNKKRVGACREKYKRNERDGAEKNNRVKKTEQNKYFRRNADEVVDKNH